MCVYHSSLHFTYFVSTIQVLYVNLAAFGNSGWHICSVCLKAAHYMCYTCTYSLCKGCASDADYLPVTGDKGFCATCMRTIMLMEKKEEGDNEMVTFIKNSLEIYSFLKLFWIYRTVLFCLTTLLKKEWENG